MNGDENELIMPVRQHGNTRLGGSTMWMMNVILSVF